MTPEQKLLYDKWSNYYNIRAYSNNEGTRYDLLQRQHDTTKVAFLDQSYTPDTTRTTATRAMLHGQLSTTVSCIASTIDIPLNFDLFTIHNHSKTETDVSTEKSVKKLTSNHHSSAVFEPTNGTETSIGEAVKENKKVDRSTFCDRAKGIDCSKNSIEHCDDIVVPELMMMMIHPYSLARSSTDTAATTVCDESRNQHCCTGSTTFNDDTTNDLRQFVRMRHHIQQVTVGTPDNISLHYPLKQIESLKLVATAQDTSREDVRGKSRTNPVITANCSSSNKKKKKKIQCDDYTTKALIQAVLKKHQKMLMDRQLADVDTTITPPTRKNNCDPKSSKCRDTAVVAPPTRKNNCDPNSSKCRDNVDRTPGLVAKAGNKKTVDTSIKTGNTRSTEENETAETILRFRSKQDERQVDTDNNKQTERRSNLLPIHRYPQKKHKCPGDESTRLESTSSHSMNRLESPLKQRPSLPMILPYPSIAQHHYLSPPPPPLISSKKPKSAMTSPQNRSRPIIAIGNPSQTGIAPIAPHPPPYARFHHPHQSSTATNTGPTTGTSSIDYRGNISHASQFGAVRREYQYTPSVSRRGRSSIHPKRQVVSLAQPSAKLPPHSTAIPTNHSKNGLPAPACDISRKDFEPPLKRQHGRSVEHNEFNLTSATGTSGDKYTTRIKPTSTNGDVETDIGVLRRVNETWKKRYFELLREEDSDDIVEVIVVDE